MENLRKLANSILNEREGEAKFYIGDKVKFNSPRQRREYEVTDIQYYPNGKFYYNLRALTGGPRGSAPSGVSEDEIISVNAKKTVERDAEGLTASERAKKDFKKVI